MGATTDLNNGVNSNTMPKSIAMVIKPFKDDTNIFTGESDGGFYYITAADLKISGLNGLDSSAWISYGSSSGAWDGTVSPNAGCPLNNTEFAPVKDFMDMQDAVSTIENDGILNNDIGHTFWRKNLGANGNWDMFGNNIIGQDAFDNTLTDGYEPTPSDSSTFYKYWSKSIMEVYCANPEFHIDNGTIGENFCDRWPPHVQNIVAVNTRSIPTTGVGENQKDNSVIVVITFVEGFDYDAALTTLTSGPSSETLVSDPSMDINYLTFNIDIEGTASWRPGT